MNAIYELHDATTAPPTYFRTRSNQVVDGIWKTPGIEVVAGSFLAPDEFTGDYSLLWLDVTYRSALGHNPPMPVTPAASRLQLHNSKLVERYLREYEKLIINESLCKRQFSLKATTSYGVPLTPAQAQEAEAIDVMRTKCMLKAEKKCRKLKMGMVDFSPEIAQSLNMLAFWDVAIKRRLQVQNTTNTSPKARISLSLWHRKKKKAGITRQVGLMTLADMQLERNKAKQDYKKHKKEHKQLRRKFLDMLTPKDCDRLKRTEQQRQLGRYAKLVTGKLE